MEIIPGLRSWEVKKRRKFKFRWAIYLLVAILVASFFFKAKQPDNSPKPSLKEVVEKALEGGKGTYGVAVKDLRLGESFSFNEHKSFEAGSLYKVWVMAEAFRQIEGGILKEDEVLSEKIEVLNKKFNISSDSAELKEGVVSLSVQDALEQMITISHNYAALLLTEKVKLSKVAEFLKQQDFNESKVGTEGDSPTSTPSDIALFLEKLYKGELVNSPKMLELLKKQQLNDKLPKYLPKEIPIAHKTGEIGFYTHDAGIIFTPKGDYIIVILSESDYPQGAEDRIAQISKAVYDYFEK